MSTPETSETSKNSITLDKNSLCKGVTGGSLITSAVIAMNLGVSKPISMGLFTSGWYLVYKSFKENPTREMYDNNVMMVSSIVVWLSAMILRMMMDSNVKGLPMMLGGAAFMGGWLTIGHKVSTKNLENDDGQNPLHGFAVPMLIFASMASINGIERPRSIASGPGIFMFSMAWIILSILNSKM